jgi:hypothetical protein
LTPSNRFRLKTWNGYLHSVMYGNISTNLLDRPHQSFSRIPIRAVNVRNWWC